jgi:hypothetical protein
MSWLAKAVLLLLVLAAALPGCGYRFSRTAPVALPGNISSFSIGEVANPTAEAWIGPLLRNSVWNELSRRAEIPLLEQGQGEAELQLRIRRYSITGLVKDRREQTLKSEVTVILEGRLVRSTDRTLLWDSGPLASSETFVSEAGERAAGEQAVEKAARRLIDRLDQTF